MGGLSNAAGEAAGIGESGNAVATCLTAVTVAIGATHASAGDPAHEHLHTPP
ncbi:MAG TPA: hypothetical protein VG962_11180 [Steroidobacteraceae bacterium]|nr:hypothetical protein [Steroidobacteraceae bacterium]